MIIGICGMKGSGKTTVAEYLVDRNKYINTALADPLKRAVKEIFQFDDEQLWGGQKETVDKFWDVTPREVLQIIGTDLLRDQMQKILPKLNSKDLWLNRWKLEYDKLVTLNNLIISDIRFPNEEEFFRKNYPKSFILVKVNRQLNDTNFTQHPSETSLQYLNPDVIINNSGSLNELYLKLDTLFKKS